MCLQLACPAHGLCAECPGACLPRSALGPHMQRLELQHTSVHGDCTVAPRTHSEVTTATGVSVLTQLCLVRNAIRFREVTVLCLWVRARARLRRPFLEPKRARARADPSCQMVTFSRILIHQPRETQHYFAQVPSSSSFETFGLCRIKCFCHCRC